MLRRHAENDPSNPLPPALMSNLAADLGAVRLRCGSTICAEAKRTGMRAG